MLSCYEIQRKFINIWLTNSGLCSLENRMLQVKSHCFSIYPVLYPEIWGRGPRYPESGVSFILVIPEFRTKIKEDSTCRVHYTMNFTAVGKMTY